MKLNYDLRNGMKVKLEHDWATVWDEKGDEVYWENSSGNWFKKEYDDKGKVIYYENSSGRWFKREYDDDGKVIYFKNSSGLWFKREYDSKGNEIYCEDSDGKVADKLAAKYDKEREGK